METNTTFTLLIDIPDWNNQRTYSFTKDYSPSQWAWEFLRRKSEYQDSWNAFIESTKIEVANTPFLESYISDYSKKGGLAIAVQRALGDFKAKCADSSDINLIEQYFRMFEIQKKSLYAAHEWMLVDMLDPTRSLNTITQFNAPTVTSESGTERTERLKLDRLIVSLLQKIEPHDISGLIFDNPCLEEPYNLQINVDMRIPIGIVKKQVLSEIERQYKEATKFEFKRVTTRNRSDKYLLYLRTLDAIKAGANKDEIGEVFFKGQFSNLKDGDDTVGLRKQVDNIIKAASQTRDNYFEVALLNN